MTFRYHLRSPGSNGQTKDWICRPHENGGLIIEFGRTPTRPTMRLQQRLVPATACTPDAPSEAFNRYQEKRNDGYTDVNPQPDDPSLGTPELAHWSNKRLLRADVEQAIALLESKESFKPVLRVDWQGNFFTVSASLGGKIESVKVNTLAVGGGTIKTKIGVLALAALSTRVPGLGVKLINGTAVGSSVGERNNFAVEAGLDEPEFRDMLVDVGFKLDLQITASVPGWF